MAKISIFVMSRSAGVYALADFYKKPS